MLCTSLLTLLRAQINAKIQGNFEIKFMEIEKEVP